MAWPSQFRLGDVVKPARVNLALEGLEVSSRAVYTAKRGRELSTITSMPIGTLITNEIKDSAGTEVEFTRLSSGDRKSEFAKIGESPALPNRLNIAHQESGSGLSRRRRSVIRFDRTTAGEVDTTIPVKCSVYVVADLPIGNLSATTAPKVVIAELMSFMASLGASTTILYDCTGTGAAVLLDGSY